MLGVVVPIRVALQNVARPGPSALAGATNREVAERLYLSPFTVNSHLKHVFVKLGIRSRVELARLAAERGMPGERP